MSSPAEYDYEGYARSREKILGGVSKKLFAFWFLIASFSLALFALVVAVVDFDHNNQKTNTMLKGNYSILDQPETQENTRLAVPEPPPPADMGGNDYMTHSKLPTESDSFVFFDDAEVQPIHRNRNTA